MDKTFQTFDRILSLAGITYYNKQKWYSKKWLFVQILNVLLGVQTFFFSFMFVVTNISNLLLCIQGACIWFTSIIMSSSLCICLIFKRHFERFLDEIAFKDRTLDMPLVKYAYDINVTSGKLNELKCLVRDTQEKMLKISRVLVISYSAIAALCCTLYISGPIYMMSVREDEGTRIIAFDMWFPWSLTDFKIYVATFILNSYEGYLCVISLSSLQSTIVLLVCQIVRQLQVMRFVLENLDDLVSEIILERNSKWQDACTAVLSQCVEHYVKTKRFSNRLNVICQPFYLTLILVATMIVCVCTVKIAISRSLGVDTMKYCIHAFCIIFAVLMFSFLGQQVENQCGKVEIAVMEKWYIYNRKHRVNVLIFHTALSQGMPIYIFGSIELCLETYTWFINTVMSFFTLVMSVLEP